MSQCVTQPTLTREDVRTSESTSTSFQTSTITEDPTTSTIVTTETICPTPTATDGGETPPCETSTITSTTVIPGGTVTTEVPVTAIVEVPFTETITLFTTSCEDTTEESTLPSTTSTPEETTPPASTPPPVTSETLTTDSLGNLTTSTITSTPTITTSTDVAAQGSVAANDSQKSRPNVAAIVGGSIGGLAGLLLLLGIIWFFIKRRRKWDDLFDNAYERYITGGKGGVVHDVDLEPEWDPQLPSAAQEPKPYHYGLVGGPTPPPGYTPPDTPRANDNRAEGPHPQHERQLSTVPLNPAQHGHYASNSGAHSLNGSISSPPLAPESSDAYLPRIPPPPPSQLSPPPTASSQAPSLTLSSAVSAESTAPPPTISPRPPSPVGPLPEGPTVVAKRPAATRTSTSESVLSSIVDYPLHHGGVLQVTNADVPNSPMSPKLPLGAASLSAKQASSPLHTQLEEDIFDPVSLFNDAAYGKNPKP